MNIIVVGAGVAGSWFTRLARDAGHKVTLVSTGTPASTAATAVLRRGYHAKNREDQRLWDRSMQLYAKYGFEMTHGATVTSYRTPGEKFDKDWHLLDPAAPLLSPDIDASVKEVRDKAVQFRDGHLLSGEVIVKATGAIYDRYDGMYATRSYGITWTSRDTSLLSGFRIHHLAPYKTIAAGVVGGMARLGSSSASTPEKATEQGRKMMELAVKLGITPTAQGWTPILGERMKLVDPRIPRVQKAFPDEYWQMRGYHRTGYALAPADAELLLGMI